MSKDKHMNVATPRHSSKIQIDANVVKNHETIIQNGHLNIISWCFGSLGMFLYVSNMQKRQTMYMWTHFVSLGHIFVRAMWIFDIDGKLILNSLF